MRKGEVEIAGATYPLCFSLRVAQCCVERYGAMDAVADVITGAAASGDTMGVLTECLWLMGRMLEAGRRYSALTGAETPLPPAEADLFDLWGVDDIAMLQGKVFGTMAAGSRREVEALPPKNAGAGDSASG